MNKDEIRDLLIECMYSNEEAKEYFINLLDNKEMLNILIDFAKEDESENAQIAAAYWISKFDVDQLKHVEERLLLLQEKEYACISGPIILALGRIHSQKGLDYLIEKKIGKEMKWEAEALKEYFRHK